jgi:hypothetical protein
MTDKFCYRSQDRQRERAKKNNNSLSAFSVSLCPFFLGADLTGFLPDCSFQNLRFSNEGVAQLSHAVSMPGFGRIIPVFTALDRFECVLKINQAMCDPLRSSHRLTLLISNRPSSAFCTVSSGRHNLKS